MVNNTLFKVGKVCTIHKFSTSVLSVKRPVLIEASVLRAEVSVANVKLSWYFIRQADRVMS